MTTLTIHLDDSLAAQLSRFAADQQITMDRYIHNTEQMQEGITEKVVKCEEKYGR